jgi:alpha-tubulin suppressor-like RCC1 family protein
VRGSGLQDVSVIACGDRHSAALTQSGMVICWGDNAHMQVSVPVGLENVIAIVILAGIVILLRLSMVGPGVLG